MKSPPYFGNERYKRPTAKKGGSICATDIVSRWETRLRPNGNIPLYKLSSLEKGDPQTLSSTMDVRKSPFERNLPHT